MADELQKIAEHLKTIAEHCEPDRAIQLRIAVALETIAGELAKPATVGVEKSLKLEIEGATTMTDKAKATGPVLVVDSASKRLFAIGLDSLGAEGATLAPGASAAGVSSDSTVCTLTPDPSPLADPSGVQSDYSAVIVPSTPPKVGVPVTLTVTVTNADGTTQPPVAVQIQFTPGTEESLAIEVV